MAFLDHITHGYHGDVFLLGPGVSSGSVQTFNLNAPYVYGSTGTAYAMVLSPTLDDTVSEVWAYVSSYAGTWGSNPDQLLDVEIREFHQTTEDAPAASVITNGTTTIDLTASPTGWVSATFSTPPSVVATKHYAVIITDTTNDATNYAVMQRNMTSNTKFGFTTKHTANGWSTPSSTGGAANVAVKIGGVMHGNIRTARNVQSGSWTGLVGNRYPAPDYDIIIVGAYTVDDHLSDGTIEIWDPATAPSGSPLHTFPAIDGNVRRSNNLYCLWDPADRYTIESGQEFIGALDKGSTGTTPRKQEIGTGTDSDLESLLPCYQVRNNAGTWEYITSAINEVGLIAIPAAKEVAAAGTRSVVIGG